MLMLIVSTIVNLCCFVATTWLLWANSLPWPLWFLLYILPGIAYGLVRKVFIIFHKQEDLKNESIIELGLPWPFHTALGVMVIYVEIKERIRNL